ncbi:1-phosphofructokinase [Alteribacter populi]|uniref:1-phosphofructokinase n=1 Tax=Alteribacter populi TaxID=2011011 RepID=UPI000BBAE106|nr:1-phosphofructokinase [Alteribacter populi]
MIYTVTLNPSADYHLTLDEMKIGKTNRASSNHLTPGGKGINVSKVLKEFGNESKAVGFLAGFTGSFIEEQLRLEEVKTDFVYTAGLTRINVKLKADEETEVNGQGSRVTEEETTALKGKLASVSEGDFLVLSGSLPSGVSSSIYQELCDKAAGEKVNVVVDASGDALKESIQAKPFLIKPNQDELGALYNTTVDSTDKATQLAKKAVEEGAQHVLVSLGAQGAVFVNESTVFFAGAPKGKLVNSVGAGDSMVAGFIHAFLRGRDLKECFRFSIASGSATAFSQGFCNKEHVEELAGQIHIEVLQGG